MSLDECKRSIVEKIIFVCVGCDSVTTTSGVNEDDIVKVCECGDMAMAYKNMYVEGTERIYLEQKENKT